MDFLQPLFQTTFFFRLATLTWLEVLDILLVALTFYMLLSLVRHSRVAFLIRGVLVLSSVLFIMSIVLPLPAFDWLMRGALIAVLVATPIIFQADVRRLLERIGRSTGLTWDVRRTAAEKVMPNLVRAIENMADKRIGALIVLEGNTSLQEVIETGVPVGGQVSSELLQSIFYPNNPLHDGAVILQEETVVAASCVLPLTQRPLHFQRRLGTRHRAAVGMSEVSDAMIIVVSEETGQISVAHAHEIDRPLDITSLRKHLLDFYESSTSTEPTVSFSELIGRSIRQLWRRPPLPNAQQLPSNASFVVISLLLAWATWTFVTQQTNPARLDRFENVSLQVEDIPPGTRIVDPPSNTVSVIFRTTERVRSTLSPRSFQATVSLEGLGPGPHRLPVAVTSTEPRVRVQEVEPDTVDIELAPVISRTMEVTVELTEQQSLSRAYQVSGPPRVTPPQVTITGAKPVVDRVSRVQATISLANVSATLQETVPVRALDEAGQEVAGVTLEPTQVQVRVLIQRRQNAKDVGVRVVAEGIPASGYWVRDLSVTPANVTLQGDPQQLAETDSFIETLPVDIENAAGDISIQIPLDLPPDIQAVDSSGNAANTVTVQARIEPRSSSLSLSRSVELIGATSGITITVTPTEVDVILSGPLPTLNAIEDNEDLVQVTLDISDMQPGQSISRPPTVVAPDDVSTTVVPPEVMVTVEERGG